MAIVDAVHRVLQATAATFFWWDAFQSVSAEHLPYAAGAKLEGTWGLIDAVEVLLHTGILPLGQGPALVLEECRLGPCWVRLPYSGTCGACLRERRGVGEIRT